MTPNESMPFFFGIGQRIFGTFFISFFNTQYASQMHVSDNCSTIQKEKKNRLPKSISIKSIRLPRCHLTKLKQENQILTLLCFNLYVLEVSALKPKSKKYALVLIDYNNMHYRS